MTQQAGSFAIDQLLQRLTDLPATSRYWVGFSGGADSTALLVALSELRPQLTAEVRAVHFNHGLRAAADDWQAHCLSICRQRNIPLHVQELDLTATAERSYEEEAREQRYAAVERLLDDGDIYLTAHHADDNAETLFINLMRGSGMDGLAAIPSLRKIGKGWVARPLLEFHRSDLEIFLRQREIPWLTDPSNLDLAFDRNYLRHSVFPELEKRWPGVTERLVETAGHARNFTAILSRLLSQRHGGLFLDNHRLALEPFLCLEPGVQALSLRQWLRDQDIIGPPKQRLLEFLDQLNHSTRTGNRPEIRWAQWQIKRHGGHLWLHRFPYPDLCPTRPWPSGMQLDLGDDFGRVSLTGDPVSIPEGWEIGPRKTAAKIMLHPGGPRRKMKELMRECGLPPWLRAAVPVLYWRGKAVAVGDWLIGTEFTQWLSANRSEYSWRPNHPLLCKLQSVSVHILDPAEPTHE